MLARTRCRASPDDTGRQRTETGAVPFHPLSGTGASAQGGRTISLTELVGTNHGACATTAGARSFPKSDITCNGSLVLRDGTMSWQGTFNVGTSSNTGTITGGTGAYANARGVFVARQDSGGTHDTITLAD